MVVYPNVMSEMEIPFKKTLNAANKNIEKTFFVEFKSIHFYNITKSLLILYLSAARERHLS